MLFLKRHKFLVGLSIDGPKELHDRYRISKNGEPTHNKVMTAARLLRMANVPFNALCVVNRENTRYPYDVYRFLTREVGTRRVQFIPCVEPKMFQQVDPLNTETRVKFQESVPQRLDQGHLTPL